MFFVIQMRVLCRYIGSLCWGQCCL